MSASALKPIALCYKEIGKVEYEKWKEEGGIEWLEGEFTLVALFGIKETLRED